MYAPLQYTVLIKIVLSNRFHFNVAIWFSIAPMPAPAFESSWDNTATWSTNEKSIAHSLQQTPSMVKVLAKVNYGPNTGFIYEGIGYPVVPNPGTVPFGGVYYYYDDQNVNVLLPSNRVDGTVGAICVGMSSCFLYLPFMFLNDLI